MYQFEFYDKSAIRDSPYHIAKLKILGGYYPHHLLDGNISFQDKTVVSTDGQNAYLVYWEMINGSPFFRILRLSNLDQKTYRSPRIEGCCEEITIVPEKNSIKVKIYKHPDTLDKTISEFNEFYIGNQKLEDSDPEQALEKLLGSIQKENLPALLATIEQFTKEDQIKEIKGTVTLDMLKNHLDDLLKSELNDEIYFETQPNKIRYQLTVNNGNGLMIKLFRVLVFLIALSPTCFASTSKPLPLYLRLSPIHHR